MSNDSSVARLARALREHAATLAPGDQLPSSRAIVARYGVSPVTVGRALARLAAEGTVVTEPGRGTFVAPRHTPAADVGWQTVALGDARVNTAHLARILEVPAPGTLVLSSGYLADDLQPTRFLATAAARAARRPGVWGRVPPAGLPELRAAFAATIGVDAGDVTVVSGGQSGLSTAFRALAPPGAPVLLEAPTYLGAVAAAQAADLRPVPVPSDTEGLRPDLLAEAFARTGAALLYAQPTFANPTGAVLAPARRQEVLDVVRAAGAFLIEDDWARHLALDRTVPPPLLRDDRDGHVVYLTSLTKPVAPSLRIGALVARGPAAGRLAAIRRVEDLFIARPLQEIAVELFGSPAWQRHLTTLRAALRERRDALVAGLRRDLPGVELTQVPSGGLHVWVRLPAGVDEVDLVARARKRDVVVEPGHPYFVTEPPGPHLRLTYAAATPAELTEATSRLAQELVRLPGT
ncbi:PLP-dependent aminotransferase family protein [Actinophytocola glycyrrhizae]|uniref:PLP-dependent aminotransferase family protein n=1 Tax=Actinophytocola glycyrrhizae TaxID=2044873 RepID=A0ABV9SGC2_9PSEU